MVYSPTLLPLLIVAGAAVVAFLGDALRIGKIMPWWGGLAAIAAAISIGVEKLTLGDFLYWDSSATLLGVYLSLATAAGLTFVAFHPLPRKLPGSFTGLILTALTGGLILVSGQSLLFLFVGLELQVMPFFALLAWPGSGRGALEAAFKYALLAALASAQFAIGIALIYLGDGSLAVIPPFSGMADNVYGLVGVLALLAALSFEIAAAPFHAWVADIYQGAPAPMLIFLSGVGKVAVMGALITLVGATPRLQIPVAIIAAASILIGNLLAYRAGHLRRMLGYSAIAHAGYFLAALAAGPLGIIAASLYALVYGIMNVGTFMGLASLPESSVAIPWAALRERQPVLAGLLGVTLLSLAGMPPSIGFFAKLFVIIADIHGQLLWLALLIALGSAFSFVYYLSALWKPATLSNPDRLLCRRSWESFAALGILILVLGWVLVPYGMGG
ncbi:MAG: NADH-quinone oxidoreductase subunit N [Acidithiobacillus sp.]